MYFKNQIHTKILHSIDEYPENGKLIANISYALSSLVYKHLPVCYDLVKNQKDLHTLIVSYKK
jgi:hypothetical protein